MLDNRGLAAASNLSVQLRNSDGSPNVPNWLYLSATQLGSLGAG